MTEGNERRWLTVSQFAKLHALGRNLVYEHVREGTLHSCRIGGKILVASNALDLLAQEPPRDANDHGR